MKTIRGTNTYHWVSVFLTVSLLVMIVTIGTSCTSSPDLAWQDQGSQDLVEIRFLEADELKNWIDGDKAFLLVDARRPEDYALEHIPTAVNVPYPQLAVARAELEEAGSDGPIVFYCNDVPTGRVGPCATVTRRMLQSGATEVYWFKGGMKAWRTVGYPVVGLSQERSR